MSALRCGVLAILAAVALGWLMGCAPRPVVRGDRELLREEIRREAEIQRGKM